MSDLQHSQGIGLSVAAAVRSAKGWLVLLPLIKVPKAKGNRIFTFKCYTGKRRQV